jgi:hypothetical protein
MQGAILQDFRKQASTLLTEKNISCISLELTTL